MKTPAASTFVSAVVSENDVCGRIAGDKGGTRKCEDDEEASHGRIRMSLGKKT